MIKYIAFALLAVGCASETTSKATYKITGDTCAIYGDQQSCDAHSDCEWSEGCACPADEGPCPPCPAPECVSNGGSGSGSGSSGGSGSGSGSAACACSDGGVCYEQVGGLPGSGSSGPDIQCYPPSACPGGCGNVCDEIEGEGRCAPDPDVVNLCICDNGIR